MEEKPVLVRKLKTEKKMNFKFLLSIFLVVVLGVGSGYFLSSANFIKKEEKINATVSQGSKIEKGMVVGIADEKTFRDSAEGKLVKGGIDGEGSHHLERGPDASQYVYLTSSTVDLDNFVDRTVKVWGETFSAQQAGWLMDVGKLKVLD